MEKIDGIEYITIDEAAVLLDVSPGRVSHFIADGRLVTETKLGRLVLRQADVAAFAKDRSRKPGPVPSDSDGG